jgi:hypothetical protein
LNFGVLCTIGIVFVDGIASGVVGDVTTRVVDGAMVDVDGLLVVILVVVVSSVVFMEVVNLTVEICADVVEVLAVVAISVDKIVALSFIQTSAENKRYQLKPRDYDEKCNQNSPRKSGQHETFTSQSTAQLQLNV